MCKRRNTLNKLEVKHLTKIFGKRQKQALEMVQQAKSKTEILEKTGATVGVYDVNFEVQTGEIFVIMGLSGSGKFTLIRLLNRLIDPTSGDIYINGQDVAKMNEEELRDGRRHQPKMVLQNLGPLPPPRGPPPPAPPPFPLPPPFSHLNGNPDNPAGSATQRAH